MALVVNERCEIKIRDVTYNGSARSHNIMAVYSTALVRSTL